MNSGDKSTGKPCVWVTRPEPKATEHAKHLETCGFSTTISPVLTIEALPLIGQSPDQLSSFDAVLATSQNAFDHLPLSWLSSLQRIPLFVSGSATETRALELGFSNVTASEGSGSQGIPELLIQAPNICAAQGATNLLYLAGTPRTPFLEDVLPEKYSLSIIEVYEAKLVLTLSSDTAARIERDDVVATTLFSSRSAKQAAALLRRLSPDKQEAALQTILAICISPMVEQAARSHGFVKTETADLETSESIVEKLVTQLNI
ncbi:MAG: uroporphyrinogen-III synthase [Hyphomicrobiales bacterium]